VADERGQIEQARAPEFQAPPPVPVPPAPSTDPALTRYRAEMRRSRIVYYAIVAVIVAALGTWVGVAWSRGEVAHAGLHTFAPAPPSLAIGAPTPAQQEVWRAADRIALGLPQWGGTVITYSPHTVGGRNARTGARTWSYTRTDRVVCTAAQLSGTTIAVYANRGNCDELSAFDSATGRRRWTRTLDMDGMPLDGQPSYQVTPFTMLLASSAVIYAIDPATGYNRWTYTRDGCTIGHVVLGGAGALISQDCTPRVQCSDLKFCAVGPQLTLRNGSDGRDDDKPNADKIIWNLVDNADVPVSADDVVSAVSASGTTLHVFDAGNGNRTASIQLTPAGAQLGPVTAVATDSAEIVWLAGRTYALQAAAEQPLWQIDSTAPPVVASTTDIAETSLATARITVPTRKGVGILDGNDGRLIHNFAVPTPQAGSVVYSLGAGFLIATPTGLTAYR
jgi:outer membrane protein assembly factor BamB